MATTLGIGATIITKLEGDPRRGVEIDTIAAVCATLDLDANFFFSPELGAEPRYTDHVRREAPAPFWKEFLMHYPRLSDLDPADLARVRSFASSGHEITSWRDWAQLADWIVHRRAIDRS